MNRLTWAEIRARALAFSKEWASEHSEEAEAKSFWDSFFNVFGISRRRVASFEEHVKKSDGKLGRIDLLWKGVMLVEHKSKGKDLDKAIEQAHGYLHGLKSHELPKYILVSDFENFRLLNLDTAETQHFTISEFSERVDLFGFIAGYEKRTYKEQDPANIEAAERMGKLHDALRASGYEGHALEVYLVRLLFCLFAEDTHIFERAEFQDYIETQTKEDGSDLAMHLAHLFQVLNTPFEKRLKTLDPALAAFAYVNGRLFEEQLPFAAFDKEMRAMLLHACSMDWAQISPAIFGAMFQSVMNPTQRRNLGAHYTSEQNIQKVIKSLFLDELRETFQKVRSNKQRLSQLHHHIAQLRFLDPACGCGNFLIVAYRELRLLEMDILRALHSDGQQVLDIRSLVKVEVAQFAGIEYDEFPARIAEVAMWLIDHQLNMQVSKEFGVYFARLPLSKAAYILHGNALTTDWKTLLPETSNAFILGNPPFIGKHLQTATQKQDIERVCKHSQAVGVLDYVAAWYIKAGAFIKDTTIKVAFVSTNSIAQGEQVGILWNILFNEHKVHIHFAHQTFKWSNEAKGNAAVYCVIVGYANYASAAPQLFEYEDIKAEPVARTVANINAYLVEGANVLIVKRSKPIVANISEMLIGSKPTDGGHLLFTDEEKNAFVQAEPLAAKWFKELLSAHEYLHKERRWCLWLVDISPAELKAMPLVMERVEAVKKFRLESTKVPTQNLAKYPTLFAEIRQPKTNFILIPLHTSENRAYIPMGFFDSNHIPNNSCSIVPNADLYLFGILSSAIHMVWVRYVCGRIKSDFRYSNTIVYNNFPFPDASPAQRKRVVMAAEALLSTRSEFPGFSLAQMYDPLAMPAHLVKAHNLLDKVVDTVYSGKTFKNEATRIAFLFQMYETYTAPMFKVDKKKKS